MSTRRPPLALTRTVTPSGTAVRPSSSSSSTMSTSLCGPSGRRPKSANSFASRSSRSVSESITCIAVSVRPSATVRESFRGRPAVRRSWSTAIRIDVSGFLISCATRRATSRKARRRSASSSRSRAAASASASSRSAWRSASNSGAPRVTRPAGIGSCRRINCVHPTSSSMGRDNCRARCPARFTAAYSTTAPSNRITTAKPAV